MRYELIPLYQPDDQTHLWLKRNKELVIEWILPFRWTTDNEKTEVDEGDCESWSDLDGSGSHEKKKMEIRDKIEIC